jgi:hypothetical protein
MLTHRLQTQSPSGLDLMALLELMSRPEDIRKMTLEARDAEKAARTALAELAAAQRKVAEGEAANTATAARLADAERKLAEDRTRVESEAAALKERLAADRRKLESEREDLQERISRHQTVERDTAERKQALDNRESALVAREKELAARRADLDEVTRVMQAKGLAGNR